MQRDIRDQILNRLKEIDLNRWDEFIKEAFPKKDINEIKFGETEYAVFKTNFFRSIERAINFFEKEDWFAYPNAFNYAHSNSNLSDMVNSMFNAYKRNDEHGVWSHWHRFFGWMKIHGIQIEPEKQYSERINIDEIESKKTTLEDLIKQFSNLQKNIETLKKESEEIRRGFDKKLDEKEARLNSIQDLSKKSQSVHQSIENIRDQIEKEKKEIDERWQQIIARDSESNKTWKSWEKDIKNVTDYANSNTAETDRILNESLSLLDKISETHHRSLEQEEYLNQLKQLATDGALGSRLDKRQGQIKKSRTFWQWAILASLVITGVWIWFLFKDFSYDSSKMGDLIINSLKTLPAFVIIGFVLKQYSKERSLEEEYAYRAGVAMTIGTYADLLADEKTLNNEERKKVIMNALDKIHSSPRIHEERSGGRMFSLRSRDLSESLKNINETLKTFKGG